MRVLLDSDFIISLTFADQSTHRRAVDIYQLNSNADFYILNLTQFEFATVVSKKFNYKVINEIFESLKNVSLLRMNNFIENLAWQEFFKHKKKGISYVDCANLVVAQENEMKIASFDKFYPKEILI